MKTRLIGLFGLLLLTPPTGAVARQCMVEYADKASLHAGTERVVNDFAARAREAGQPGLGALQIRVETTPGLVYFSSKHHDIVVPWWGELDPQVQGIFVDLAGDSAKGQRLFNVLFNQFFIAHEAGHWLRFNASKGKTSEVSVDYYQEESEANQIAVAYWMTTPDGEACLTEIEDLLKPIIAKMPNPVPAATKPAEYFNTHYAELGENPVAYGWFQFRFVLDALAKRKQLKFQELVKSVFAVNPEAAKTSEGEVQKPKRD